jgi:hypothetical protein
MSSQGGLACPTSQTNPLPSLNLSLFCVVIKDLSGSSKVGWKECAFHLVFVFTFLLYTLSNCLGFVMTCMHDFHNLKRKARAFLKRDLE